MDDITNKLTKYRSQTSQTGELILTSPNETELLRLVEVWQNSLRLFRMEINHDLLLACKKEEDETMIIDGERLNTKKELRYLRAIMDNKRKIEAYVNNRIKSTTRLFYP